jgi:hypothetical protein
MFGDETLQLQYSIQNTPHTTAMDLIPVGLDIKGIYEEYERGKRNCRSVIVASSRLQAS